MCVFIINRVSEGEFVHFVMCFNLSAGKMINLISLALQKMHTSPTVYGKATFVLIKR